MYINVHGPREHQSLSGRARPFSSDLQRQAVPCDMFSGRNLRNRNVPQVCGWTGPLASSGSPWISVFEALSEPCQAMGHFTAPRVSAAAPAAASTPWRGRSPPPSPQRPGTELSGRAIIPTPEIRKFRQGHGELVLLLRVYIYIYIYIGMAFGGMAVRTIYMSTSYLKNNVVEGRVAPEGPAAFWFCVPQGKHPTCRFPDVTNQVTTLIVGPTQKAGSPASFQANKSTPTYVYIYIYTYIQFCRAKVSIRCAPLTFTFGESPPTKTPATSTLTAACCLCHFSSAQSPIIVSMRCM